MRITLEIENDNLDETPEIDFELPNEIYEKFEKMAKEKGTTVEKVIHAFLRQAVAENEPN
jgi:hypothetical protein